MIASRFSFRRSQLGRIDAERELDPSRAPVPAPTPTWFGPRAPNLIFLLTCAGFRCVAQFEVYCRIGMNCVEGRIVFGCGHH